MVFCSVLSVVLVLAVLAFGEADAAMRGLPWAYDNKNAHKISKGLVKWYHHWQMGRVRALNNLEYVPTYWGPSKAGQWGRRKGEINRHWPQHILAFNEPDIEGQANMDPDWAVEEFMKELQTYADRGVRISSPQIVYNLDWLQQFLDKCNQRGCKVSFIALHWYGSWKGIGDLQKWITTVHNRFNLPIWVTEFGVTSESNPSGKQVHQFMSQALGWLDSQPYVERVAWYGGYSMDNPPDGFATPLNALFRGDGILRRVAYAYMYGEGKQRRMFMGTHGAKALASRAEEDDAEENPRYDNEPVHCDDACEQRRKYFDDN